jgi:hypothetical protein
MQSLASASSRRAPRALHPITTSFGSFTSGHSVSSTCSLLASPLAQAQRLKPPTNSAAKQQTRSFIQYLNRKDWFPWRERLIRARQKNAKRKRNILPRYLESGEALPVKTKKLTTFMFKENEMVISMKKLIDYGRLVKKKQIDDAIENIECLERPSTKKLLDLLHKAKTEGKAKWSGTVTHVLPSKKG